MKFDENYFEKKFKTDKLTETAPALSATRLIIADIFRARTRCFYRKNLIRTLGPFNLQHSVRNLSSLTELIVIP
jgi:hypothetical protein